MRSFGMTQRGCRFACGHCIVRKKEGAVRSVGSLSAIWRGDPYPKHIVLLDNDLMGQPQPVWEALLEEARSEKFRIALSQGINVRAITRAIAAGLASIDYYDNKFRTRRLYTAWDSLPDERIFMRGIGYLLDAGVKPDALMVYMLVGKDPAETWERIMYRFSAMTALGLRVYPMPYRQLNSLSEPANAISYRKLKQFQRWSNTGVYKFEPFENYDANTKGSMAARRAYRERALTLFEPNAF